MKLQLHRSGRAPQWAAIAPVRRNFWQRLAASSASLLTPGNLATLVGFGLVVAGLAYIVRDEYGIGFCLVVAGRLADILDGYLAERTGTKSPLGEKLDAGVDKVETGLALVALLVAGVTPLWLALSVAVPHLLVAAISGYGMSRRSMPQPSWPGKAGMALAWVGLGLLVLAEAGFGSGVAETLNVAGYAAAITGSALTLVAMVGYWRAVWDGSPSAG